MNKTFKTSPVGLFEPQPESAWIKDVWNGAVCRLDRIYKGLWQEDMAFQSVSPVLRVRKIKEAKSDYFLPGSLSSTNWARMPGNNLLNNYPHTFKILIAAYASSLASSPWGKKNTHVCLLFSAFTALLPPAVCLPSFFPTLLLEFLPGLLVLTIALYSTEFCHSLLPQESYFSGKLWH